MSMKFSVTESLCYKGVATFLRQMRQVCQIKQNDAAVLLSHPC